jgi:HD-GYP domain-containing protein (c-di-GMP phosphodiesterase class II)
MTSDRPYRKMKSKEEAVDEIVRCSGTQFDQAVVTAFLQWVKDFNLPRRASVS